jgi:hypothetical protein
MKKSKGERGKKKKGVLMKQLNPHWTDFDKTSYLRLFLKLCRENSSLIKIQQK